MVPPSRLESFNAFSQIEQVGDTNAQQLLQELTDAVAELDEINTLLTIDERSVMAYDLATFSLFLFSLLNTYLAVSAISLPENPLTDLTLAECVLALVSALGFFILILNRGIYQGKRANLYQHESLATVHQRRRDKKAVVANIFEIGIASQLIYSELPVSELSEKQKQQASALLTKQLKKYLKVKKITEKAKRQTHQTILINRLIDTALIVGDELPDVNIEQLVEEPKKERQTQKVPS